MGQLIRVQIVLNLNRVIFRIKWHFESVWFISSDFSSDRLRVNQLFV